MSITGGKYFSKKQAIVAELDHRAIVSYVRFYSYDTVSRLCILLIRQQDRSIVDQELDGSFCLFAA